MLAILLVSLSVGLSNLAAAISLGIAGVDARTRVRVGLVFGAFESGMPVVGLVIGSHLATVLGEAGRWLGGALLIGVGLYAVIRPIRLTRPRRGRLHAGHSPQGRADATVSAPADHPAERAAADQVPEQPAAVLTAGPAPTPAAQPPQPEARQAPEAGGTPPRASRAAQEAPEAGGAPPRAARAAQEAPEAGGAPPRASRAAQEAPEAGGAPPRAARASAGAAGPERPRGLARLLVSGLALSLDNLVIGFALGTYQIGILAGAIIIGTVSVSLSLIGLELGAHLGRWARRSRWNDLAADQLGGVILISVGVAVASGALS